MENETALERITAAAWRKLGSFRKRSLANPSCHKKGGVKEP